jgi:hypothetical protein
MIIQVDTSNVQPIDGIATSAGMSAKGDVATVSVAVGDLIAFPRPGQRITLWGASWEVIKTVLRTPQSVTFTCRRLADG